MSFWTDIRDTIEAPFKAVGGLVSDLASGKNVFDSVGQLGAKEFAAFMGPTALLVDKTPLKVVLQKASPFTLGITGDIAKSSALAYDINTQGKTLGRAEAIDTAKYVGKDAAIIGAAVLTGGAVAGAAPGLGTAGAITGGFAGAKAVSSFANTGDPTSLIQGATGLLSGGGLSLPDGFSDAFGTAKNFYDEANAAKQDAEDIYSKFARNAPVAVSGYSSNQSGYASGSPGGGNTSLYIMAGLGMAAFILMRRHGHA